MRDEIGLLVVKAGVVTVAVELFVIACVAFEPFVAASVTVIGLLVVPWVAAIGLLVVVRLLTGRVGLLRVRWVAAVGLLVVIRLLADRVELLIVLWVAAVWLLVVVRLLAGRAGLASLGVLEFSRDSGDSCCSKVKSESNDRGFTWV